MQQLSEPADSDASSGTQARASGEQERLVSGVERVAEPTGLMVNGPTVEHPSHALFSRPALAVMTLLSVAALTEVVPAFAPFRLLRQRPEPAAVTPPRTTASAVPEVGEAKLDEESSNGAPGSLPVARAAGPIATGDTAAGPALDLDKEPPVPLLDSSGKALDGFYSALDRVRQKGPGAIARIAHFGDSVIVSDYVSGTLRRKLQEQFGDAGHGFQLIANAWPAYFHNDVTRYATAGWKVSRIVGPLASDGWYGLGGVSFKADAHALARWGTAKSGDFGKSVARFELVYVEEPKGGRFQVRVDGKDTEIVDTTGPEKRVTRHEIRVPDGQHELEIQTLSGQSRLFGVIMERDVPGVVLDALGVQGARIRFMDQQDDAHWAEALKQRKPDLVVYEFGANESADGLMYAMVDYHRTMKEVVAQGRAALPDAGCLIVGAMDRAQKKGEDLVSMGIIPLLTKEQQAVADELGCAFFDTNRAMRKSGGMPIWVKRGLGQSDLTHPTGAGSETLGTWLYRALMKGYLERRKAP